MSMQVTRNLLNLVQLSFFVKSNGDTTVERQGILSEREVRIIREFIKDNYKDMYLKWNELSNNGFFGE